jgi:hypothetical protein
VATLYRHRRSYRCSYKTVLCYSSRRRLPSLGADKRQAGITATSARSVPTANVIVKTSCTHSRVFQLNMVPSISRSWHHIGRLPNSGAVTAVTGFAIGMNAPHRCDSRHSNDLSIGHVSPARVRLTPICTSSMTRSCPLLLGRIDTMNSEIQLCKRQSKGHYPGDRRYNPTIGRRNSARAKTQRPPNAISTAIE